MAEPLPAQLRTLVDELARQKGLPPGAARDVEAAIASSPYLAHVMVDAANQKTLKHIGLSTEKQEGGHYDKDTGTVFIRVETFTDNQFKPRTRLDMLTGVLGHETGHALTANARSLEIQRFSNAVEAALNAGTGNVSYVDLTRVTQRYLDFTRRDEALAEMIGMNAVASRISGGQPDQFSEQQFLKRVDPVTSCVDVPIGGVLPMLASGIGLRDGGMQLTGNNFNSPAIEALAVCHYDQGSTLGRNGDSNYRNYYGPHVFSIIAAAHAEAAKGTTQAVPDVRLDLKQLKLDLAQIERNGVELGSPGKGFSFTDTSDGHHAWKTVRDTSAGPRNPMPKDVDIEASPMSAAFRADSPGHPDHRSFQLFHSAIKADGRWSETEARNIAAAGLAAVKADSVVGSTLTGVVVGKPNDTGNVSVFGYASPHGPQGPHHHVGVDASSSARVPAEQSLERVEQLNQHQQQVQQQAQTQSTERPTQAGHKLAM